MKAGVLYADNDIRYEDYLRLAVGDGDVEIRVMACGICGSDIPRVRSGGAHFYPIVLGHEFSGIVTAAGRNVKRVKVGDRVAVAPLKPCMVCDDCNNGDYALCGNYSFIGSRCQGGFAEYAVVPEKNAVVFDGSVDFVQGALFEPSAVALHGVMLVIESIQESPLMPFGHLPPNSLGGKRLGSVAVIGGGTIGSFTAQWARISGAESVTVFDICEKRLELCKKLGADSVVNTALGNRESGIEDRFDCVFETAGQVDTIKLAYRLAKKKGKICFIGTPTKDVCFTRKEWEILNRKELTVTGSWMGYSAPFPGIEWEMTAKCFADGSLRFDEGLVFKSFPMAEIAEAFALYEKPGEVKGKIVLVNK
jgi:L-iditol 2-dehydrogenase